MLLVAAAWAWDSEVVFDGTPSSQVATVAAVKSWSATDEVFVLYEVMDLSSQPFTTQLYLAGYQCTPADCSTVALVYGPDPVGRPLRGQPAQPSMAISAGPTLRVLHRGRTFADCDGDGVPYEQETSGPDLEDLDLVEDIWTPAGGWTTELPVVSSTSSPCGNRGLSSLRHHPTTKDPHACWAHQPPTGPDELECGSRPLQPAPYLWSWTTFPNGGDKQDHAWLEFDLQGERVVAHRNTNEAIAVRFVDAGDVSVPYDAGAEEDYPVLDIARGTGVYHLAWHEADGEDSLLSYARCEPATATASCQDWADWSPSLEIVQDTGENLKHVGLAVDRERVFLVYMEDIDDDDATEQFRVRWRTRCGTEPWSAPETLRTPVIDSWHQSIVYGRPVLAVNRRDNVLHVVFTESDTHNFDYTDSDVIWTRTTYEDCPP